MRQKLIISGGKYKGVKITCPPNDIRPAMSIMRETLFQTLANLYKGRKGAEEQSIDNVISAQDACVNKTVVDLFSGSALMALECFSRGAVNVVAVESDKEKWNYILKNIERVLPTEKQAENNNSEQTASQTNKANAHTVFLYKDKVERFLLKYKHSCDIIYCDPPFAYRHKDDLLLKIAQSKLLHANTIVAIHVPTQEQLKKSYKTLSLIDKKIVGSSTVYFFGIARQSHQGNTPFNANQTRSK